MDKSSFGLVDSSLLEKIDKLFACNAGDYVDLPQLVVVGLQSSGKSSVLEGLTRLPFPRDSGLCTRFATQITFRRSNDVRVSVSIVPAKDGSAEHQDKLKGWRKQWLGDLDAASFSTIMTEVIDIMGVGPIADSQRPAFARDVLVLEIAGPSQEHFSVIDVPGTFKRTTPGVTTKADIALVDDMVHSYMANPRSVMLIVVPCNADIATQEVVEQAEDLDPDGDRTLGVLTKPDLVDKGAEKAVIELIEGKQHRLKLGWHLLRNPGQAELVDASKTRSSLEEAFFRTVSPWNRLDKERVGIVSLRTRLQTILAAHIRREFPKVKAEISQKLRIAEERLRSLGLRRQTPYEQRQFLIDIAINFQEIATLAVRADYGRRPDFFAHDEYLHLATAAVNRGAKFANDMSIIGHTFDFRKSGDISDIEEVDFGSLALEDPDRMNIEIRLIPDHADVEDIVQEHDFVNEPQAHDILAWLKSVYRESRGFELGTFNSGLLTLTMQQQASKWRQLALGYISDIITLVHSFVDKLLRHIVPSQRARDSLRSLLLDELINRYRAALKQTEFLLKVELEGTPATYNHYFNDNLAKYRQERLQQQLSNHAFSDCQHGHVVRFEDIIQNHPMSNDDYTIRDVHDILSSYYKLSRKRFVDNMRMQAADHFLVTGADAPLKLFSPKLVTELTEAQLEDFAGEEPGIKCRRADLEKEMKLLQEAMSILR